jgi:hypothetical protein
MIFDGIQYTIATFRIQNGRYTPILFRDYTTAKKPTNRTSQAEKMRTSSDTERMIHWSFVSLNPLPLEFYEKLEPVDSEKNGVFLVENTLWFAYFSKHVFANNKSWCLLLASKKVWYLKVCYGTGNSPGAINSATKTYSLGSAPSLWLDNKIQKWHPQ